MRNRAAIIVLLATTTTLAQTVNDSSLKVQQWVGGLSNPTGMVFVDEGTKALVIEKNSGRVKVVSNRQVTGTALDLPVNGDSERGLLGIALSPTFASDKFIYLNYTRATSDGAAPTDHRVERYRWTGSSLTFDRRVLTMPATPGPNHDGGKITFGPDGKLYAVMGDLNRNESNENFENAKKITRSGAILRVNPSGTSVTSNPFYDAKFIGGEFEAINDIYAYGIRNSFGLAFDPLTGNLWDTENGADRMDEINRVDRGFNSGWEDIMGPTWRNGGSTGKLVSLGAAAHYEEPKLSWDEPVAPTDAFFMDTARIGARYKNDLFVGTVRAGGVIYRFDMSPSRKTLGIGGPLADGVADNSNGALLAEQSEIIWGNGFGVVTDILSGPGGMYVLSLSGSMYRITTGGVGAAVVAVPEPSLLAAVAIYIASSRSSRRTTTRLQSGNDSRKILP